MGMTLEWVVKINRVDKKSKSANNLWQPDGNSHVCSDHFTKDCFTMDPELAKASGYKQLFITGCQEVVGLFI
jgi:hypothetical protein